MDLFEIERRINQIKRNLQNRQEKASEYAPRLTTILKPKPDPMLYLAKSYRSTMQCRPQASTMPFQNELKELEDLQKRKNKYRLLLVNPPEIRKKVLTDNYQLKRKDLTCKAASTVTCNKENSEAGKCSRERSNPFIGLRYAHLLEMYLKNEGEEEGVQDLTNELGIGIQNTPYHRWTLEQTRKAAEKLKAPKPKLQVKRAEFNMSKKLSLACSKREVYLQPSIATHNLFEHRMKRLFRQKNQLDIPF